jgi:hypothetical protein
MKNVPWAFGEATKMLQLVNQDRPGKNGLDLKGLNRRHVSELRCLSLKNPTAPLHFRNGSFLGFLREL